MKSSQTKGAQKAERARSFATQPCSHVREGGVQNNSAIAQSCMQTLLARICMPLLYKERGRPSERGDTGTSVAANQLVLSFVSAMLCVCVCLCMHCVCLCRYVRNGATGTLYSETEKL